MDKWSIVLAFLSAFVGSGWSFDVLYCNSCNLILFAIRCFSDRHCLEDGLCSITGLNVISTCPHYSIMTTSFQKPCVTVE